MSVFKTHKIQIPKANCKNIRAFHHYCPRSLIRQTTLRRQTHMLYQRMLTPCISRHRVNLKAKSLSMAVSKGTRRFAFRAEGHRACRLKHGHTNQNCTQEVNKGRTPSTPRFEMAVVSFYELVHNKYFYFLPAKAQW